MASCEIDGAQQEDLMQKRSRIQNKSCIKCKTSKGNLTVRGLVYCRPCIQALVVQRFKKSVNDVIPPATANSTTLAVGFSGGLGSTLLLDLVSQLLSAGSNKRTRHHRWDKIYVIYIDHSKTIRDTDHSIKTEDVDSVMSSYPHLNFVSVPLENAFLDPDSKVNNLDAMRAHLESMPTNSAVRDSIQVLTRRILERTAISLGATHLLLGRSMSSLSKALLSNICSGRAFTISDERLSKYDGLTSFNPLQEVGSKECAACVWWSGLHILSSPIQESEVTGTNASISQLTRAFISGLEKDYPSTVSTIVKTCAKVVPKGEANITCRLCSRRIQADESSVAPQAVIAITARQPSNHQTNLCYACKTMLTSANSKSPVTTFSLGSTIMPVWARDEACD